MKKIPKGFNINRGYLNGPFRGFRENYRGQDSWIMKKILKGFNINSTACNAVKRIELKSNRGAVESLKQQGP